MKQGIAFAGNLICDTVMTIKEYPQKGRISQIYKTEKSVGGLVPNTAINFKKMSIDIPTYTYGRIGEDENGKFLLDQLKKYGINCDNIVVDKNVNTSFCDVMSEETGERTFFSFKGANEFFSPDDIDISSLNCDIFHLGYLMLLDQFDKLDEEYGTVTARFLCELQKHNIKTSIDLISDETADFVKFVLPAIKYCDYVIINEFEISKLFGLEAYKNGEICIENIKKMMHKAEELGVKEKIIVHSKTVGFIYDVKSKEFLCVTSLDIPSEEIKGSVGAGDTYCAGCLYGIYNEYSNREILEFASSAAACNLFAANSIDGLVDKKQIINVMKNYRRKKYDTGKI